MELLTQRYNEKISGILGCYDRLVTTGTLPVLSNASHLTSYLYQNNIAYLIMQNLLSRIGTY